MTRRFVPLALAALTLPLVADAEAGGRVTCEVTENGGAATGSLALMRGDREVARGTCDDPVAAPAGSYTAVLALDGALDGPERRQAVDVAAGATSRVSADFETGMLEVRIQADGRRAAGMAIIRKNGAQIGTLGSGVAAHLSAGRYDVVARYRTLEKAFDAVVVAKGAHVVLEAAF